MALGFALVLSALWILAIILLVWSHQQIVSYVSMKKNDESLSYVRPEIEEIDMIPSSGYLIPASAGGESGEREW